MLSYQVMNFNRITLELHSLLAKTTGKFFSLHRRPVLARDIAAKKYQQALLDKTAIVIQGPLIDKFSFTMETIKLYKRIFPELLLIVSTWKNEDSELIKKIRKLKDVELVLSKTPKVSGPAHFNYQLISSKNGIIKAKQQGADFVVKTRSDQRIYNPASVNCLYYLSQFPIKSKYKQKSRLVTIDLDTFKYRPYGLSDMLIAGNTDDVLQYFSAPHDRRKKMPVSKSQLDFAKKRICETRFSTYFLEAVGRKLKWTLQDSWEAFADHFAIADTASLDFYWPKYSLFREYRYRVYDKQYNSESLHFADWFCLYQNMKSFYVPEDYINMRFEDSHE